MIKRQNQARRNIFNIKGYSLLGEISKLEAAGDFNTGADKSKVDRVIFKQNIPALVLEIT